jgi:hypothetical protein
MGQVVLVPRSMQFSARPSGVAFFAALLALVLVWTGTLGIERMRSLTEEGAHGDTAERGAFGSVPDGKPVNSEFEMGSELKGEELEESEKSDHAVAVVSDPYNAHVMLHARAIGEVAGPSTIRPRRVAACIGARGPPVG